MQILYFIGPLIGGLIIYAIIRVFVRAPGTLLQTKFSMLTKDTNGTIAGKTLAEIENACGKPNSVSAMGNGQTLCQWQSTGYHIALLFDENNVCLGVSSETKV